MEKLLSEIFQCRVCQEFLKDGCNPLVRLHPHNKVLIIGQAPGLKVHQSGQLWADQSGDNLRAWLGVDEKTFYQSNLFGMMPMGFCYPGKGTSGDNPPRPECAPLWHPQVLSRLNKVELTLLVGKYAQHYYLKEKSSLTEMVKNFEKYLPHYLPLPHPSPRNFIWQSRNSWFKEKLIPKLQRKVASMI